MNSGHVEDADTAHFTQITLVNIAHVLFRSVVLSRTFVHLLTQRAPSFSQLVLCHVLSVNSEIFSISSCCWSFEAEVRNSDLVYRCTETTNLPNSDLDCVQENINKYVCFS